MFCEIRVDLGARFGQLGYGMDGNRTPALSREKGFEGFLACLLGHETGIGVIAALLMPLGDAKVVLGLAEPAQSDLRAWLHR